MRGCLPFGCLLPLVKWGLTIWMIVWVAGWIERTGHINPLIVFAGLVVMAVFGGGLVRSGR
jgi:hypothetical protein